MNSFKHRTPIQIRFKDIDQLGHVNNANHLSYFELARMKYSSDVLGKIDWSKTGFILAGARIDYRQPILLEDSVEVLTHTSKMGTKSFEMEHRIIRTEANGSETILASGSSIMVCMDYTSMQSIAIPDTWKKLVGGYEGLEF
jgi:acyl-CoA thioester hydrolase